MSPCKPQPDTARLWRRLALWVLASVGLHVALTMLFSPASPAPPRAPAVQPLRVDFRVELAADGGVATTLEAPLKTTPSTTSVPPPEPTFVNNRPAPEQRQAAGSIAIPSEKYYMTREVDVSAAQINDVQLVYPKGAYEMRVGGRLRLRLFISERGVIDAVSVVLAEPQGVFEQAAIAASQALVFSPAIKDGRAVKSQKLIEVVFDPYESINTP